MSQDRCSDEDKYALAERRPSGDWVYGPNDRVVLNWKGMVVGIAVADVVFFLFWTVPSMSADLRNASYVLSIMGIAMIVGFIPIGVLGSAVAWPLGLALRRIRNQWIHVAAFFMAGALICVPFGGFWNAQAWAFPVSIAVSAGLARLAVWKLARINDEPSFT